MALVRFKQFLEEDRDLAPRQVGAETEVRAAAAEGDVVVSSRGGCRSGRDRRMKAASRLPEGYQRVRRSPFAIGTPETSVSSAATRLK